MYTLLDSLLTVGHPAVATLVSPVAWERISAVADRLPAPLARWLYLERRLDLSDERVDLIVGVERTEARRLAEPGRPFEPMPRGIRRLARAWSTDQRYRSIERCWLEYDVLPDGAAPAPGVFLDLEPAAAVLGPAGPFPAVHPGLACLGLPPDRLRPALQLLARLQGRAPGLLLPYVGYFPDRADAPLRVCLSGVAEDTIAALLTDLSWPGEVSRVVTVLAAAGRAPSVIHLDLGPELLPSVGFEFGLDHGAQLEGRLAEGAWLTEWVRRGWCRPELVAGLCRWPEVTTGVMSHEVWPSLLVRRVNHLKLVLDAAGRLACKGYLCFTHAPLSAHRPRRAESRQLSIR